jgi:Winged helix DNA-binding domain
LLTLTRDQILSFRRWIGGLDARVAAGPASFRLAAWAGLQDSMPRAALLSLHARIQGVRAPVLDDPSLIQVWGPRYTVYMTAAEDRAVFTLGRWPEVEKARERATLMAARLAAHLDGRRESYDDIGDALGINPNALRYGTTTGTVLIRWEGARAPLVWTVPAPEIDPADARAELARRYLHVFGPGTPHAFAKWAGVNDRPATAAFESFSAELLAVRTPLGEAWVLASDEEGFRAQRGPVAPARLLPSGDAYYLFWGADRALLVPDGTQQAELWTPRVWPGAVLLDGELAGTWRRAQETVSMHLWKRPTRAERDAVKTEAAGLPIPGCEGQIRVVWE